MTKQELLDILNDSNISPDTVILINSTGEMYNYCTPSLSPDHGFVFKQNHDQILCQDDVDDYVEYEGVDPDHYKPAVCLMPSTDY